VRKAAGITTFRVALFTTVTGPVYWPFQLNDWALPRRGPTSVIVVAGAPARTKAGLIDGDPADGLVTVKVSAGGLAGLTPLGDVTVISFAAAALRSLDSTTAVNSVSLSTPRSVSVSVPQRTADAPVNPEPTIVTTVEGEPTATVEGETELTVTGDRTVSTSSGVGALCPPAVYTTTSPVVGAPIYSDDNWKVSCVGLITLTFN
jgi:hypothetical protein